ncbi:hypothetical protein GMORB2_0726 [Geosmithia morbida]|uniref:Uncharacterized protein n=1 Tax=Geosmithia morbida TaxID=1094350 RepID=A0A9P4Z4A3_9HYPO|nr:uncharacterized protein GMORB2_0726 [Geosmithia morbida]KAF4126988.1 hypothetical protein GMORB2_0726 [Geosmithia morbida]
MLLRVSVLYPSSTEKLPSDTWPEGISVRRTGDILVTCLDEPDILVINVAEDPDEPENRLVKRLHRFPDANGIYGIGRVPRPDDDAAGYDVPVDEEEFAVVTGTADVSKYLFGNWTLWRITLGTDRLTGFTTVLSSRRVESEDLQDFGFFQGMVGVRPTGAPANKMAACDLTRGRLCLLDIETGSVDVVSDHDILSPSPYSRDNSVFGANRVRFTENHAWVTSWSDGALLRIPVSRDSATGLIRATGPPERMAEGFQAPDGLSITRDGTTAYIGSISTSTLWRVDGLSDEYDSEPTSTVTAVRTDLATPTAMDLFYPGPGVDPAITKPTLYICSVGSLTPEVMSGKGDWLTVSSLDTKLEIMVTVTTEITYEYV